jgi:hypothetical protein
MPVANAGVGYARAAGAIGLPATEVTRASDS